MHDANVGIRGAAEAGCVERVGAEIPHVRDPEEAEISLQEKGARLIAPLTAGQEDRLKVCPAYVPSCQEARYCSCSAVSLSSLWPILSSLRRAISLSRFSGTT